MITASRLGPAGDLVRLVCSILVYGHAGAVADNLRSIFDEDADLYDRSRPDYPPALFADLVNITGIGAGSTVVEIGPGTGQATRGLLATGAAITAVEIGANMARRLQTNLPDVRVVNAAFEDWTPPAAADLVTSFTAWHWVDRKVRARLVHQVLCAGGHLATVTTSHVRGGSVEFFDRAQESYLRWDPATDTDERLLPPDDIPPTTDEIDTSELFGPGVRRRYVRDIDYTADTYLDVLRTYSNHRAWPEDVRNGLLSELRSLINDDYGGVITKTYLHELRIAPALSASGGGRPPAC